MLARLVASCVALVVLAGCGGGTRLVKQPTPPAAAGSVAALAQGQDGRLQATLDWVVVRNGPGSWAKNADWDEYLLRVANTGTAPVRITRVAVVDSTGTTVLPLATRKGLVRGSKQTVKRYRASGLNVRAGAGGAGLMAAGIATTAVGVAGATAAAYGSALSGGSAAGGAAAAGGLLIAGPAVAIFGIVRAVRNSKVNTEIVRRSSVLPVAVGPGAVQPLDLLFPLAPSPQRLEIDYADASGSHRLDLDLRAPLAGLHLGTTAGAAGTPPPR
jgi:hypothetical protein